MPMTDQALFCTMLDTTLPGLEGIDQTYLLKGLAAAEKQLADYVRGALRPADYFKIPYYPRENDWALHTDDDFAAAEKIIRGELQACGVPIKYADTAHVNWHANPTYNNYCEWPWQLSRHHEFRCLGWCYRQTGDEKYAKAYTELLMSWYEQAPCPTNGNAGGGDCWRTIEAGIRMTKNWHYAFHAFYRSPWMTDHVLTTYVKSICDHGFHLRNFHVTGNWLIMEMAGLAHIAMLYPFLTEAAGWGAYAFAKLEDELTVQVYPDGFQYELATGYHDVVIRNYHYVMCTANAIGYKIPRGLSENLKRMFELNIKIACPDRHVPDLNDGGRTSLLNNCTLGLEYFPDHDNFLYFATDGVKGAPPDFTSVALPYAGMAFMRTGWEKDALWCMLDAGPFGKGHQHEDMLNVLMFGYGKNVMPDSGNYIYDTSQMRRFVLDTRSHNTAMVDDLSQNRRATYRWQPEMIAVRSDIKWRFTQDVDTAEGVYDEGYGKDLLPVTHARKLIFFKHGVAGSAPFALVIDRFESGDGLSHTYQPSYQMGAEPFTDDGERFTADHGDGVTMHVIGSQPHGIVIGQYEPLYMGWRKRPHADSEAFEHTKAPCVRFALEGTTARLVTVLCPDSGKGKVPVRVEAAVNPADTTIRLTFTDGSEAFISEADYPCCSDAPEKLS